MDATILARVQFAMTVAFHFLFPPITLGLSLLIAVVETCRWRTGNEVWTRMSDFWLKILAVNFVVGVATGIVMEFQFGTNWAGYSRFVGDIFGAPLAAEGVLAFFLESGFLGLLLLGRRRISSFVRWLAAVLVWVGSTLSGFWIIVANSWMQTPAGFEVVNGRARLTDFAAAVFNPSTIQRYTHTIAAGWVTGAFLMAGVGAWYLLKGRATDVARLSVRLGAVAALAASLLVFFTGDRHARQVAHTQHAKFAAMEGVFSTEDGAPLILFSPPPTQEGPRPGPEIAIANLTSFLAFGNFHAPIQGLRDFPREDWPPVAVTFLAFHNMVIVANVLVFLALWGAYLVWRKREEKSRLWLWLMVLAIPLPHVAMQLGWATAEVGRQPWIVYGVLRTKDAVSKVVPPGEILFSILLFAAIYAVLFALWLYLLAKEVRHGPEGDETGPAHGAPQAQEA
jgi:cytochrome bd ubiquinol oxidase subunit I